MMNEPRVRAKEFRKSGNYIQAVNQYRQIWESKDDHWDIWLGWEYADSLKKIGQIDEAIYICKNVYVKEKSFKYNNDLLCWCLYEKYIKNFESNSLSELQKFIEISNFITTNTIQDGKKTAYEATVFKVLKVLQQQNNVKPNNFLKWLDKLNFNLLTEDVIEYQLSNGRTKEGASRKEMYFQIKSKALQKENRYVECIECCDLAFKEIQKFHFDNQIWLDVRRQYSICMSCNDEGVSLIAANRIVELANQKKHWSIFYTAFECFKYFKDYDKAIINASIALLSNDPLDKKINLLYQVGQLMDLLNQPVKAQRYYLLVYKIRKENVWSIPRPLTERLDTDFLLSDYSIERLKKELRLEWTSNIKSSQENFIGVVSNIVMPKRKSGFIKKDTESYFFNIASVISGYSKLKEGAKVSFNLIDSVHPVRKVKVKNAVNIEVL